MELIQTLAETGILGLLLAISIGANYFLYKEIKYLQNKRVEDAKEIREQFTEPMKAIKQTVDLILILLESTSYNKPKKKL
jgi:hypothetical protein